MLSASETEEQSADNAIDESEDDSTSVHSDEKTRYDRYYHWVSYILYILE